MLQNDANWHLMAALSIWGPEVFKICNWLSVCVSTCPTLLSNSDAYTKPSDHVGERTIDVSITYGTLVCIYARFSNVYYVLTSIAPEHTRKNRIHYLLVLTISSVRTRRIQMHGWALPVVLRAQEKNIYAENPECSWTNSIEVARHVFFQYLSGSLWFCLCFLPLRKDILVRILDLVQQTLHSPSARCASHHHSLHFSYMHYSFSSSPKVQCCVALRMTDHTRSTQKDPAHHREFLFQCQCDLSPDKIRRNMTNLGVAGQESSPCCMRIPSFKHHHHNPFPCRLRRLLDDATIELNEHIVSWLPDGKSFKVHDPDTFTAKLLGRYFFQKKFSSFTRQL